MARAPRPLDEERLRALALAYVARYATSTVKLRRYLNRKLREAGWDGEVEPDVEPIIARCVALSFVDDAAFASARAAGLSRKGLGAARIRQDLRGNGLDPALGGDAAQDDPDRDLSRALYFAHRRRIGPFAGQKESPQLRQRWIGQLARAGHSSPVIRRILSLSALEAEELLILKSMIG